DYRPVILALKGFQYIYHLGSNCLDQLPGMQSWAEKPSPLPTTSVDNFVNNVVCGLKKEGVYSADFLADYRKELSEILSGRQQLLR
ncbi:MAG: hypothetical protein U9Q39_06885, partial [Pseudomonadota bacterium]|nr:hypothetical protein [Pseudomonadota bacterium]